MQFIKPLQEIARSDVAIAGGKGASLGEMTKAGIPVPRGFVILSRAFQNFIQKQNFSIRILFSAKQGMMKKEKNCCEELNIVRILAGNS